MSLGVVNVDAMLRGLTAKQLAGWVAYMKLDPFGQAREDIRHARVLHMMHNTVVAKKDQRPVSDFLLSFDEAVDKPKQGPRDHAAIFRAIARAYAVPGTDVDEMMARRN